MRLRLSTARLWLATWLCAVSLVCGAHITFDGVPAVADARYGWLLLPVTAEQWGQPFSPIVTIDDDSQATIDGTTIDGGAIELGIVDAAARHTVTVTAAGNATTYQLQFTTLPIVNVTGTIGLNYSGGNVTLVMPGEAVPPEDMAARIKWRGASTNSIYRHKRNYAIKFVDETGEKMDRTLLGLRHDNKWILDAGQVDLARVRNRVATELWNDFATPPYYHDQDERALTGVRGQAVELLLNGSYDGIYFLTEAMDRKQMKLKKYDEQAGEFHGMLYKTTSWSTIALMRSLSDMPDNTADTWHGVEVKYPDMDDVSPTDWSVLRNAVNFVATASDTRFGAELAERFDLPVLIDYFLFCNLLNAQDNLGKNIYWGCYDMQQSHKLTLAVWDLDCSVGQNWDNDPERYRIDAMLPEYFLGNSTYSYHNFRLFNRMVANESIARTIAARYAVLRQSHFAPQALVERYTTAIDRLIDSGAARRDSTRWSGDSDLGRHTLDYAAERAYIVDWLLRRSAMMDKWFDHPLRHDVNRDGEVNATDVSLVVSIIAGLDTGTANSQADVNNDSEVNATDIAAIISHIAGL